MKTLLTILMPVYNDWQSFAMLLSDLEATMPADRYEISVVAVDDRSDASAVPPVLGGSVAQVDVIRLQMNVGHQRAIAVGLVHIDDRGVDGLVAVMDSDGEDTPGELARMLEAAVAYPGDAIVAQRRKRSETLSFRFFYAIYIRLFAVFTGQRIDFGNFSLLTSDQVKRLIHNANIWNNFAATLIQAKLKVRRLPTTRGRRYAGRSHMNLVGLVTHGLGAISVFSQAVFVRLLIASLIALGLICLVVATVIVLRLFTHLAVPGWTTNVLGFSVLLCLQLTLFPTLSAFQLLNSRSSFDQIPKEHAHRLIEGITTIYRRVTTA